MDTNYPLEVIIGLLVLAGLIYMGDHRGAVRPHPTAPASIRMPPEKPHVAPRSAPSARPIFKN